MKDWSSQLKDVLRRYYPLGTGCKSNVHKTFRRRSVYVMCRGVWGAGITFEELKTVLLEKELTLNNRPLTFTYKIPGNEVLTLSHLIYGRRINTISIKLERRRVYEPFTLTMYIGCSKTYDFCMFVCFVFMLLCFHVCPHACFHLISDVHVVRTFENRIPFQRFEK